VFHESRGKHYSNSFGEGDTLGLMICLPNDVLSLPPTHKNLVFSVISSYQTLISINVCVLFLDIDKIQKSFVL